MGAKSLRETRGRRPPNECLITGGTAVHPKPVKYLNLVPVWPDANLRTGKFTEESAAFFGLSALYLEFQGVGFWGLDQLRYRLGTAPPQ